MLRWMIREDQSRRARSDAPRVQCPRDQVSYTRWQRLRQREPISNSMCMIIIILHHVSTLRSGLPAVCRASVQSSTLVLQASDSFGRLFLTVPPRGDMILATLSPLTPPRGIRRDGNRVVQEDQKAEATGRTQTDPGSRGSVGQVQRLQGNHL